MSARFWAWYTSGAFAFATLLLSFVSVALGAEVFFWTLQAVTAGGAAGFACVGVVLTRLPQEHWCNQSLAVRWVLFGMALLTSFFLVTSVV